MNLRNLEKHGKRQLTRALGRALRARGSAPEPPDLADLGSILLIRQQNQLGDMLLSTPVFRAVRERAPDARIDLVSGPPNHEAASGNRHLNEVLCYDKAAYLRRPRDAKRFSDRLRDARYDLAIVMSTVSFSVTSAWLCALSKARWRAGRPGPGGKGREIADDLYHWVFPEPRVDRHQTGVNLDGVTPFGVADGDWAPELCLTPEEATSGSRLLDDALGSGGREKGLRILVHPGAGKLPNRWPADRFGEVAAALQAEGHRVAVATGPSETELFASLDRGAGRDVPRLPGATVRQVAGALGAADLVLVNDTGVLHLAASVRAPVLALFGPTDPRIWCPAAPDVRWMRAPEGDLRQLPAGVVIEAAVGLAAHLGGHGNVPDGLRSAPRFEP